MSGATWVLVTAITKVRFLSKHTRNTSTFILE